MLARHLYRCNAVAALAWRRKGTVQEAAVSVTLSSGLQTACWSSSAGAPDAISQLSSAELHCTAKLARLSGLCYGQPETLAAKLQIEGLQVEAQGQTAFTR